MRQFKNFCVFAAALCMVFGGFGLAALCFRKPEMAAALGGILLPCFAAVFLINRALLRFAPQRIARKQLDKSIKNGGMAWITRYEGNENLWLETESADHVEEESDESAVFAVLERRQGLERLYFSADWQSLRESGLENGARVWACVLLPDGFKVVWFQGRLELAEEGGAVCVVVQRGKLSGSPKKYFF